MSSKNRYSQTDIKSDLGENPISDFKYNFTFNHNSLVNRTSSMFYMTMARVSFIESSLEDGLIDGDKITYDFSNSNYLPSLPNSIFSRPDYKNTDILITKNTEFIDGYIGRGDLVNKSGAVNKSIFNNLGLNTPELVKDHLDSKDITKPSYILSKPNGYLERFTESYNKPYMPMFFGYKENGYESIGNDVLDLNKVIDINMIEKCLYYTHNLIDEIDSLSSEVNASVGKCYLDAGNFYNGSNIHYVLSLLNVKSYKREGLMLADRPRGTIDSITYGYELNDLIDYIDNVHGAGEYVINGYNKFANTDTMDNNLAFLNNFISPDTKVNPAIPFQLSILNNMKFPNELMLDIAPSVDVREYLMVRDSFASCYKDVEFKIVGDAYVSNHGRLDIKTLKANSVLFSNKFFDQKEISFNNKFIENDLEYYADKGTRDSVLIDSEDGEILPIASDKLIRESRKDYAFTSFKDVTSTKLPVYPFTGIPVFSIEKFYKNKTFRNYRYEGSFFNPIPLFSSPINGISDFNMVYNGSFRAGMGISVMSESIKDSLTPGYEGKGFANTYSNNYCSIGNGASYLIQRLKMRTGIALTIRPSLDKLSLFKDVIVNANKLAMDSSKAYDSRTFLDPLDTQNYIITNESKVESGYSIDKLYLPTERFNSTFVNYDSILGFKENDGVKIGITTIPTNLKCLSILDTDIIYSLPHRANNRSVRNMRIYVTTNTSSDGYVNNVNAITNTYIENCESHIPIEKPRGNYRDITFRTPSYEKLDNIVVAWYKGANRVFLDNITINSAFKNSRYEEITGTMLLESSLLFHNELLEDFTESMNDMESKRSSNPIVRECINVHNYRRIKIPENGFNKQTSKLVERFGKMAEKTILNPSSSSVLKKVSPNVDLLSKVLSKYN